jgi:ferredoxin
VLNLERVFGLTEHARQRYAEIQGSAALCRLCGKCLKACPQKIDIPARLADAVAALDPRAGSVLGWCELRGAEQRDGDLALKLRYIVKNFTKTTRNVRVSLMTHGEDTVRPADLRLGKMEPYARKQRDVELEISPVSAAYCLDALIKHEGGELVEHLSDVVIAARRATRRKLDAWRRQECTVHVPSPYQRPPGVSGPSFDFAVCYDDEHLYVFAEVEDDMASLAPAEVAKPSGYNHLRLCLDGRTPYMIGHGSGHQDGVMFAGLYPRADESAPAFVRTSNQAEVEAVWRRTPTGYRIDCAIPWKSFCRVATPPAVIGFDIGVRCFDAQGVEKASVNWTGRQGTRGDTSSFGKLVTV